MSVIEPVPKRSQRKALRDVLAGTMPDDQVKSRAEGLRSLVRSEGKRNKLWWARDGRNVMGAALVLGSAGRVGFLYHSPETQAWVDRDVLSELLGEISRSVLAEGYSMIQALIEPELRQNVSALRQAGFEELAELVHLRRDLSDVPPPPEDDRWEFCPGGSDASRQELIETISRTYQGTLDCPKLAGLRKMEDVIASHKTAGIFTPQWWWLLRWKNQNVGCILVNRCLYSRAAEVSYMGVIPEFRRRGLGWRMLCRAARDAHFAGLKNLILAVDSANTCARTVYDKFGFVEVNRKFSYALLQVY